MTTAIQPVTQTSLIFGDKQEIEAFANRIRMMMRGGEKLSAGEAMALAQVAKVTKLNPFIGEVWYIPGSGPMIGIAGARRTDQEAARVNGGYSTVELIPCSPDEAGATEVEAKDVVAAFRAEITDTAATLEYQKMFVATLASLRDSGVSDPVGVAREICGPRPKWTGYGFSKKNESTRMSKVQAARKRAEADALKKKIVIPFGAQLADSDVSPDYVDVTAQDVTEKRTEAQNTKELGFSDDAVEEVKFEQTFPSTEPAAQTYKYNSQEIMLAVAKILKYDNKDAMQTLYESRKANKIKQTLTIAEAEAFARDLIAPK